MNTDKWYVYMLECADNSIYIGCTNHIADRIAKHNSGYGAKYTRGRGPVKLKVCIEYENKSEALKAEYTFKQWTRKQKLAFIKENQLTG